MSEQRTKIKAAAEAATPGPWVAETAGGRGSWIKGADGTWTALSCGETDDGAEANAAFIALASPAPQPAVEAQGVTRYGLSYVETTVGELTRSMMPSAGGAWVRFTDYQRALASEKARADRLEAALRDARDEVEHWGQYASDYFQEKHGLDQALAALLPTTSEEGKAG